MTWRKKKIVVLVIGGLVVLGFLGVGWARSFMNRNRVVEVHEDIVEHFKYGSIGAEKRLGVPAPLWNLFPVMFADHLPKDRPGNGWEKFGFLYEPGKKLPIGTSRRELPVELIGLNCAAAR